MKTSITLDDKDLDAIAARVVAALAKAKPGKPAAAAEADEGDGEGDGETGEGDGDAEASFEESGEGEGDDAPDRDAVRAAMVKLTKASGNNQDVAMAILKKTGGASALSKLKDDKFAAVIAACEAKIKATKK